MKFVVVVVVVEWMRSANFVAHSVVAGVASFRRRASSPFHVSNRPEMSRHRREPVRNSPPAG